MSFKTICLINLIALLMITNAGAVPFSPVAMHVVADDSNNRVDGGNTFGGNTVDQPNSCDCRSNDRERYGDDYGEIYKLQRYHPVDRAFLGFKYSSGYNIVACNSDNTTCIGSYVKVISDYYFIQLDITGCHLVPFQINDIYGNGL